MGIWTPAETVVATIEQALRSDPRDPVASLPAKLVAGLLARRAAGAAALTILSCDNLPENGAVTKAVVQDLAALVDETLPGWIDSHVDFATSMVDRITPVTTDEDRALVEQACGYVDAYPVATEPFSEWVISGAFPGRSAALGGSRRHHRRRRGAFEQRKLWLLNGVTLDAGLRRQHPGILRRSMKPSPIRSCRSWVEMFWDEASRHLTLPGRRHRRVSGSPADRASPTLGRRPAGPDRGGRVSQAPGTHAADAPRRASGRTGPHRLRHHPRRLGPASARAGRPGQGPRSRDRPEGSQFW